MTSDQFQRRLNMSKPRRVGSCSKIVRYSQAGLAPLRFECTLDVDDEVLHLESLFRLNVYSRALLLERGPYHRTDRSHLHPVERSAPEFIHLAVSSDFEQPIHLR